MSVVEDFIYIEIKRMADILKPGEICSIDQALRLGLYDTDTDAYLSTSSIDLSDTRTYSADQLNDYQKPKAFCRQYQNEKISYPLCPLVGGVPYTQVPGDPSRCMAASTCPPGFQQNPNDITECTKPSNTMMADRSKECGEKPYDWYTIPNYHLGNRFKKVGNGCYKPCTDDRVPYVLSDPIDKEKWNINTSNSNIDIKCVSKADYLNGKYASDPDYCPIATIKQLGFIPSILQNELKEKANERVANIPEQRTLRQSINTRIAGGVSYVQSKVTNIELQNIVPGSKQFQVACEKMVTPDEIAETYAICKNIKYHPNTLIAGWRSELYNDTSAIQNKKTILEQACHEVFCNKPENAMEIGEEPLCFKTKKIDTTSYNENIANADTGSCAKDPITNECLTPTRSSLSRSTKKAESSIFANDFMSRSQQIFIGTMTLMLSLLLFYFLVWRKGSQLVGKILGKCKAS